MAFYASESSSSGTYAEISGAMSKAGASANITDSDTSTHNAAISGGGANNVFAWFDGTEWRVLGVGA